MYTYVAGKSLAFRECWERSIPISIAIIADDFSWRIIRTLDSRPYCRMLYCAAVERVGARCRNGGQGLVVLAEVLYWLAEVLLLVRKDNQHCQLKVVADVLWGFELRVAYSMANHALFACADEIWALSCVFYLPVDEGRALFLSATQLYWRRRPGRKLKKKKGKNSWKHG